MKVQRNKLAALALLCSAGFATVDATPAREAQAPTNATIAARRGDELGVLTVEVIDFVTGKPLPAVRVEVSALGPIDGIWAGETGKSGVFELDSLSPGPYSVTIFYGSGYQTSRIQLTSDEHETVRFVVPEPTLS
jgi:hypothetical protein